MKYYSLIQEGYLCCKHVFLCYQIQTHIGFNQNNIELQLWYFKHQAKLKQEMLAMQLLITMIYVMRLVQSSCEQWLVSSSEEHPSVLIKIMIYTYAKKGSEYYFLCHIDHILYCCPHFHKLLTFFIHNIHKIDKTERYLPYVISFSL